MKKFFDVGSVGVVIFGFNRPEALRRLVGSLEVSPLFGGMEKFVFVDGPRDAEERKLVEEVADFARSFSPNVVVSEHNKGLGPSIIAGVSEVLRKFERVIVLEDDLWCAPGFLEYMVQGLDRYADDKRVCSVCGYGLKIKMPKGYVGDVYLSNRSSSWGWGTWRDRWEKVDWEVSDYDEFISDRKKRCSFNRGGSDMTSMLMGYMKGLNRSWAIRFCYWQWREGLCSVHPFKSLVANEGYGENATNCRQKWSRFKVEMDLRDEGEWDMPDGMVVEKDILSELRWYHSLPMRVISKVRRMLNF